MDVREIIKTHIQSVAINMRYLMDLINCNTSFSWNKIIEIKFLSENNESFKFNL